MKMHIAQSGKNEGSYVICPAQKECTISAEENHMFFKSQKDANEYNELRVAKEFGGVFGSGISERESERMSELENIAKTLNPHISEPVSISALSNEINASREKMDQLEKDIRAAEKSPTYYEKDESANIQSMYDKYYKEKRNLGEKTQQLEDISEASGYSDDQKVPILEELIKYDEIKLREIEADSNYASQSFGIYDMNVHLLEQLGEAEAKHKKRLHSSKQELSLLQNKGKISELLNVEKRPEYIASIDSKHFDISKSGSTFTDESVKNTSDVLAATAAQRGGLDGDDRDKLIAAGADPASFLPPESGVRYLQVNIAGTQALRNTSNMRDDEILTIVGKGRNDGSPPSLSFSSDVHEQPKTDFGTVVIGPDLDENKKPIPNTEVLWTLHPGIPTRGIRSDTIRENGLEANSQITVKELRERFGKDIQVNTRLV